MGTPFHSFITLIIGVVQKGVKYVFFDNMGYILYYLSDCRWNSNRKKADGMEMDLHIEFVRRTYVKNSSNEQDGE